jgi:hypothetical protein
MRDLATGEEKTILRVRGITLSGDVCKQLHFVTMKESIFKFAKPVIANLGPLEGNDEEEEAMEVDGIEEGEIVDEDYQIETFNAHFIQSNVKGGIIISKPMKKFYSPIVTKGIVTKDLLIQDFGSD